MFILGENVVKKIVRVMLILLILLSLAACSPSEAHTSEEVAEVSSDEKVTEVPTDEEAKIAVDTEEVVTLSDGVSKVLTDEEVKLAYEKAREAYSWFDLTTMNVDANSQKEYNGDIYMKVNQDGIQSLSDLEAYLHSIFSDEIVDSLLETNRYIDIDGALYAIPADRGTNIFAGEEHHKIIRESDKIIYEVTVDILDENFEKVVEQEVYSFSYEFIEGKWVFTNFSLVV